MAKKLLQDMVKTRNEVKKVPMKVEKPRPFFKEDISLYSPLPTETENNTRRYGLWVIALLALVFLFFAVSFLFTGAKITVNPKTKNIDLDQTMNAIKDSTDDTVLPYDLVTINGTETKNVQGGEAVDVASKAEGKVLIYNAYNATPQNFSANTRLLGSNGKIYKTESKITVPGMADDGTPGSAEVSIAGEVAGVEYNSAPLDFKIASFKGTSKYSKIYAESEGNITGGLKGKYAQISDDQKSTTITDLRNTLQADLFKKVTNQIPDGYILFKDAVFLKDDGGNVGVSSTDDTMVPVTLTGTLYGLLFQEQKLSDTIVKENIPDDTSNDIYISNVKALTFSLVDKENVSFKDVTSINFTLTGSAEAVWKVDTDKLIGDLLGKSKGDFNQILSSYTNIASADSVVEPVWAMSFPDKSEKINVFVNYPK